MYLKKIKVVNYKCFEDSGWVEFGGKFNIVIGQNNSGKTALLEVLDKSRFGDKPHRSVNQAFGSAINPTSETQIIATVAGGEIYNALMNLGQTCQFPIAANDPNEATTLVEALFAEKSVDLSFRGTAGCGIGRGPPEEGCELSNPQVRIILFSRRR